MYRLEHEQPNVRNPAVWLTHLFQSLYTLLTRSEPQQAGRAAAVLARMRAVPEYLDAARATIDDPPSIFVDTALAMLGGGGELIAQAVGQFTRMAPDLAGELSQAGEAALKSLVSFAAVLSDEI